MRAARGANHRYQYGPQGYAVSCYGEVGGVGAGGSHHVGREVGRGRGPGLTNGAEVESYWPGVGAGGVGGAIASDAK